LHWAASHGHEAVVQTLVKLGADVTTVDKDGDTPLHYAALNCHAAIVQALVNLGADVKAVNQNGNTPLHDQP